MIALPYELHQQLRNDGVELADVVGWRHYGQDRYRVALKDGREITVAIYRDPDAGRYMGD